MKKKFSIKWKSSARITKQRKYRLNAPLHRKRDMLSCSLSKELRKKYNRRAFAIRKGDSVRVMGGNHNNKKGKIADIDIFNGSVYVEGIQKSKRDGTKANVPFSPSVLQITELNLEDKKRIASIENKIKMAQGGKK